MKPFTKESDFQKWANETLTKLGVHFYHISSKNKYVRRGILDLTCFYRGITFVIELKVGNNNLSEEQEAERDKLIFHGIPVYVCYTQDEFMKVLSAMNVIK